MKSFKYPKYKSFRLLTAILAAVMFVMISLNVYAASGPDVTKDGLTVQLQTDKDSYSAEEIVQVTVRVDNNTGRKVLIETSLNLPSGVSLVSGENLIDATLQPAESWITLGGFSVLAKDLAAANTVPTGDNMQVGFWAIMTVLSFCGLVALFVYGKNRKSWLAIFLSLVMVGGMAAAATPAQAEEITGTIVVSCNVSVDGETKEVSATVKYTILEDEASTEESTEESTEASTEESTEDTLVLHVSVGGAAVTGCSEETHYADLAAVRDALRDMDHSEKAVEVLIHAGTYQISEKITFEAQDSGSEEYPVVYKAAGDGEVIFTGSTRLSAGDFKAVSDAAVLARIPETARVNVRVLDLAAYNITKEDVALASRYDDANNPFAMSYLYVNDNAQTMSRYPNASVEKIESVIRAEDTANSQWAVFAFEGSELDRWTTADQAYIVGHIGNEWCRDWIPVGSIDTANDAIALGGKSSYGLVTGGTWYITNLLEEIDLPGEYFIDANELKLYWYPTEELSAEDKIELTTYSEDFLDLDSVSYVEFEGIHFQHTLGNGIDMNDCSNVTVRNCTLNDIESFGIVVNGSKNLIEGCAIYEIGLYGVYVSGGADPETYTESNNRIANNHLWKCARQNCMTYLSSVSLGRRSRNTVIGDVLENNIIHGSAGAGGVTYGGLDNIIQYNEMYSLLESSSDGGLIYCWSSLVEAGNKIRYNYLHDFGPQYNSGSQVQGIYWDDSESHQTATHNIIVPNNKLNGAGNLATGAYNTLSENIVVNSYIGIRMTNRNTTVSDNAYGTLTPAKGMTDAVVAKYPQILELKNLIDNNNKMISVSNNVLANNLCVDVVKNTIDETVINAGTVENNRITDDYSVFVDAANHDYRLTAAAMELFGFPETFINENNFDMNSIGIQTDVFAVETPEEAFNIVYPAEGQKVISSQVFLKWDEALFADEYVYTVATDKEMSNVLISGETYSNCVEITGLEKGKTYYFTVQAKTLSKQIGNAWYNADGIRSFVVSESEILDTTELNEQISKLKAVKETIVIGTAVGTFKAEVTEAVNDILARAEALASLTEGDQSAVDAMVEELKLFIEGINGYKNIGYADINIAGEWKSFHSNSTANYATFTGIAGGGIQSVSTGKPMVYLNEVLNNYEIQRFRMKVNYEGSYMAIALRQNDLEKMPFKTAHSYVVVIKADQLELQKYDAASGLGTADKVATCTNDNVLLEDTWYDIEFGAVDVIGGVRIVFKVGNTTVFDYVDTEDPKNYGEGYFTIYPGNTGSTIEFLPANEVTEEKLTLHVAADAAANGDGSEAAPYASIKEAQEALRGINHTTREVEVLIHAGTYQISEKITFEAQDSGSEEYPVTYKAAGDGAVILTGSTKLQAENFTAVTDEAVLARIQTTAQANVKVLDLSGYTTIDWNTIGFASRFVDSNDPLATAYLYLNDEQQMLSRYPNSGFETINTVKEAGNTNSGSDTGKRGCFVYESTAPDRWQAADQAYIVGLLGTEYSTDWTAIGSVDTVNNTITVKDTTGYGIKAGGKWYATNLLEEIDLPGEYFLDVNTKKLYYYPTKELTAADTLELTTYNDSFLSLNSVKYVSFEGMNFQHTLSDGIVMNDCSNVTISGCTVKDAGFDGIEVNGQNNLIEGCTIYETGLFGVKITGGGSPATYTQSNNRIANNHFWKCATQNCHLNKYAISLGRNTDSKVIGDVVENNIIHGNPGGQAIIYGGLDNVIRYNEIYSLAYELADCGLIYAGRRLNEFGNLIEYNYIHDYGCVWDASYKVQAIYWDDWQSGQTAKNNIIVANSKNHTSGNLAVGTYNTYTENIVVNSYNGLHMADRGDSVNTWSALGTARNTLTNSTTTTAAVLAKYPQIAAIRDGWGSMGNDEVFWVTNNVLTNNLTVNVETQTIAQTVIDGGTVSGNVDTDDMSIFVDAENHDYRLTAEALTALGLPDTMINVNNFDMNNIGIQKDVFAIEKAGEAFGLVYPANGQTEVLPRNLYLKWDEALYADQYVYEVATDAAFENVVATGTVFKPLAEVEGLAYDTTYYYRVTAQCLSKQIGNSWANTGEAYSFTTVGLVTLDTTELQGQITELQALRANVNANLGTEFGQYKADAITAIDELLTRAQEMAGKTLGIQEEVDELTAEVKSFIAGIGGYKNSTVANLNVAGTWVSYDDTKLVITNTDGVVKLDNTPGATTGYLNSILDNNTSYRFKMNLNTVNYASFGLRQADLTVNPYKSAAAYVVIIKADVIELQKYLNASQVWKLSYENSTLTMGKWCEVELGAVDVVGGVEILLKVDGTEVFRHQDTDNPIYQEGYFTVHPGKAGSCVEFADINATVQDDTTDEDDTQDSTETEGDGIYFAYDFETAGTSTIDKTILPWEGNGTVFFKGYESEDLGKCARVQINGGVGNATITPIFDEVADCDNIIVEVMISRSSAGAGEVLLQYPYNENGDLNTLLHIAAGKDGVWTVGTGEEATQVGSGYAATTFAFKINVKTGKYTAYTKDAATGEYTALIDKSFSLQPLADGYILNSIRLYVERTAELTKCLTYIDNFTAYEDANAQNADEIYFAYDFETAGTATIDKTVLPWEGTGTVFFKGYASDTLGNCARVQINGGVGSATITPTISAVTAADNIIVEVLISRSSSGAGEILLQYPYNASGDLNTLLHIAADAGGAWTVGTGEEATQVGSGCSATTFAFKVNVKAGTYTAYTKDATTGEYTALSDKIFTLSPLESGYTLNSMKLYVERTAELNKCLTYIDNFTAYEGTEFRTDVFTTSTTE